jgi:predicted dithiol-disulfide oxidoreductase (DUF899 family)
MRRFGFPEAPGVSVFYRDAEGDAYHTYSCYARGLDALHGGISMARSCAEGS